MDNPRSTDIIYLCLSTLLIWLSCGSLVIAQEHQLITFNIPQQTIQTSIVQFGLQADITIALGEYSTGNNSQTNAVIGEMTVHEGLQQLLAGTPYQFEQVGLKRIRVFKIEQTEVTADDAMPSRIEEVVVTSQLRPQNPERVPIALTIFTADQLAATNTSSIEKLATMTPGLLATRFSYANPIFAIRGAQNTFSSIGSSEPTGVFLDDVYISRFSASDLELYDLESVVVQRGPQGTLFGRNVTGGAIMLFSEPPSAEDRSVRVGLTAGNHQFKQFRIIANTPLDDKTAVKLSALHQTAAGQGEDLLLKREQDDLNSHSVRLQMLAKPSADTEVTLGLNHSLSHNNGRTLSSARFPGLGIRQSVHGVDQHFARELLGANLRVSHRLAGGDLIAITGYRKAYADETFSRSDLNWALLTTGFQEVSREMEDPQTLSQEFRFISTDTDRGHYVGGIYLFLEDGNRRVTATQRAGQTGGILQLENIDQAVLTQSYAAFFDTTRKLNPELSATLGIRYTHEKKTAKVDFNQAIGVVASFTERDNAHWESFTPRAVLSWTPDDRHLIYASFAEGFTAGGFNTETAYPDAFHTPFEPERSRALELGFKFRSATEALSGSAVIFRQKYYDKQEFVQAEANSSPTILNAALATSDGVELDAVWRITDHIQLAATYAWLEAKYDQFDVPGEVSRSGNTLAGAPTHQYSSVLTTRHPSASGEITTTLGWRWRGQFTPSSTNSRYFPSVGLLNAQIGYAVEETGFAIQLWADNLLDARYQLSTTGFAGSDAAWYGPARSFGLTVTLSLGE